MLAVIIVFSIWYVAGNIATVIRYRRTRADIEVGSQITEYRSYRRRKTSAMMMLLIMLVVVLGSFFADYTIMDPAESLEYENEHLVRYAEFDPESWAIIEPMILSNTDEDVWVDCFTAENSSTIKRKEIRERVDVYYESEVKSGTSFTYDMFYNELRSEKLAVDYIDDALKYECAVTHEEAAIEVAGVDYAAFAEDDGVQHLYLRKGDRVVEVYYIGDVDIRSKVELFAGKLR